MAGFSDYVENKLVDHMLRGRQWTAPTQVWVALYTAAPTDAGGGTEVSGNAYARATPGANSDTMWNATQGGTPAAASNGTGGATANATTISFPTPTGSWGTCTHFGVFDASTGGNLLFWAALTTSQTPNTGNTVSFAAGALTLTID